MSMDADQETGIKRYLHCCTCIRELNDSGNPVSPSEYAQIEAGVSPHGDLIIWCKRHNMAVCKIANARMSSMFARLASRECDVHTPRAH